MKLFFIAIPGLIHTLGHVIRAKMHGVTCRLSFGKWYVIETFENPTREQMRDISLWGFGAEFLAMYLFALLAVFSIWGAVFSGFYAGGALWHWLDYPTNHDGVNDFDSLCTHTGEVE